MSLSVSTPTTRKYHFISSLKVSLSVIFIIMLGFGIMLLFLFDKNDEIIEHNQNAQMFSIHQIINSTIDHAEKIVLAESALIGLKSEVSSALKADDYEKLKEITLTSYNYLKKNNSVNILGFHNAKMDYVIRLHNLKKSGDNMALTRPMILAANKSQRSQTGLEIGVTGLVSIRGISIVKENDKFVGTAEVGMLLEPIIEQVKTLTNADIAVILKSKYVNSSKEENDRMTFGPLTLSLSTDNQLFSNLLKDDMLRLTRDIKIKKINIAGHEQGLLTQPLLNFNGEIIGILSIVSDFSWYQKKKQEMYTDLIVVALCFSIIAFILFSILLQMSSSSPKLSEKKS